MSRTGTAGRWDDEDLWARLGNEFDFPVTGDWSGDGIKNIGVFRDGRWRLDEDGDGRWSDNDRVFRYGRAGDLPVVGDFDGDGLDEIGVYRGGQLIVDLDGNHELDAHDAVFALGGPDDLPVAGDWNGDGVDEPGVYHPGNPGPAAEDLAVVLMRPMPGFRPHGVTPLHGVSYFLPLALAGESGKSTGAAGGRAANGRPAPAAPFCSSHSLHPLTSVAAAPKLYCKGRWISDGCPKNSPTMRQVTLMLPEAVAREAEAAGLLRPEALEKLLRAEIRRRGERPLCPIRTAPQVFR